MNEFLKKGTNATKISDNVLAIDDPEFAEDVRKGLSAEEKFLSSKYFYNDVGDDLFQQIMEMPEYYLTNAEYEILNHQKQTILEAFSNGDGSFNLIEFGAGDGYKTSVLLEHFMHQRADFKYLPIDISGNVLEALTGRLTDQLPGLPVKALQGEYFQVLKSFQRDDSKRKVVLFLGSNIGNFAEEIALDFLQNLARSLGPNDLLFIGFDLKKDPAVILSAYNDKAGITAAFNLNLLTRINQELGGSFDLDQFRHYPTYDPKTGQCRSYLISTCVQEVKVEALDQVFHFDRYEPIHTEISQKFNLRDIQKLAGKAGFEVREHFFDTGRLFVDCIWGLKG